MKKEEWKDGEQVMTDEDETVNQASALWARRKSEITDEQYTEFYKHVAHDFEDPLCLDARPGRGQAGIHAAAVHPGARAVRPVGPQRPPWHQALRAARLHHGRRRTADAALPAFRARRDRFERPAAQRLARNPAGEQGHRGDPRRLHAQGAVHAGRPRREPKRKNMPSSGKNSERCSRKASARTTPTRTRSPSCCASPPRTTTRPSRMSRWPITSAA